MKIRLANSNDLDSVINFYKEVSAYKDNGARWIYGVYPTDEDLFEDIKNNELYILLDGEIIVSAAVLKMEEDKIYKDINWQNHNPTVLHLLGTLPSKQRQGYAKSLLKYLINVSKENKRESMHLDIVPDNNTARKLYESLGFKYVEDKEVYYPDTGLMLYSLFELILND